MISSEMWKDYKLNSNSNLKKEIIKQYTNLVYYVIKRSKFVNLEIMDNGDFFQFGIEGLSEAIDRYDPDYGTKFETYAIQRIRGKIIDELRKIQIKPRSMTNSDGNKPYYTNVSLNQPADQEEGYLLSETIPDDKETPETTTEKNEEKYLLMNAIKGLPEKQRLVITLYYYEDLTYKEIAKILAITVSRVSQIHSQVVKILRRNLQVLSEGRV
ncbi:RNA polymerase sigma factor FliA [bacterium BMS3Abin03]|nr:RNA polymerase sigma factor FliA [bacterium BMS3Abin03]